VPLVPLSPEVPLEPSPEELPVTSRVELHAVTAAVEARRTRKDVAKQARESKGPPWLAFPRRSA